MSTNYDDGRIMTNATVSPLEAHLGYWIRFVSNHVSNAFARKLQAREVTVAEWVVLRELYETTAVAPSALAERLGLTRGAVSKLMDRLLAKALVTRTASKEDRRYQSVGLTAAGRALVPKLSALADKNDAEFFGHLAKKERALVETLMRGIVERQGLRSVPIE